jgi:hypothetical protein
MTRPITPFPIYRSPDLADQIDFLTGEIDPKADGVGNDPEVTVVFEWVPSQAGSGRPLDAG